MTKLFQISILVAIPIILIVILNYVVDLPPIAVPLNGKINEVQKQSLSILLESNKLLISFSIAIAGALAFFIREHHTTNNKFTGMQMLVLSLCGVSCLMTIFFGQLLFSLIVEMLANDFINILSSGVVFSIRAQYGCLLLAVSSLIVFVYMSFSTDSHNEVFGRESPNNDN